MSLKPIVRAVLFDLDGVLLDTEPLYSKGIQEVVSAWGKIYDWSIKRDMIGRSEHEGARILISRLELPVSIEEYMALREPALLRLFASSPHMQGAPELVAALAERGVPMAVATSSKASLFRLKSAPHAFFATFQTIVCGDDAEVKALKPAPDIFLRAAQRIAQDPRHCLVIEDSPAGVQAARSAGMQVIAIPDAGLGDAAVAGADLVVHDYAELTRAALAALEARPGS